MSARLAVVALALLAAAPARAAEGGSGAGELIWMGVNLLLLLAVLVYFGRKPVRTFFADRRHRVQRELKEAEELRSEVESKLAGWQRKLTGLEEEEQRLRSLALQQVEAERDRILADANATAERIRRDAGAVIEQELRRAQETLRAEAAELTIKRAADLLRQQVGDADRERLLDEFIASIEQQGAGRAAQRGGAERSSPGPAGRPS